MDSRKALFKERKEAVENAVSVKTYHLDRILGFNNVVGAGVGYKVTRSRPTDEISIVVAVTKKLPKENIKSIDLVPSWIDGIRTDVIETGRLRAQAATRPAQPGCSIAHAECTAGTFGCVVERDGEQYILSNNHVLALINQAAVGDPILQPGPADGGTMADQIATLADFVRIDFGAESASCKWANAVESGANFIARMFKSSHRLQAVKLTKGVNQVDAAIAKPLSPDLISPEIGEIGVPAGVAQATLGTRVKKTGRTTGFTAGTILAIEMTTQIEYDGPKATFQNQYMATGMSQPGDSGSCVLDQNNCVVGLLFAGSSQATIINPIDYVMEALNVSIVTL
ncbi:MAG: hypothetical protein JXA42_14950 [Anaerolineales bacterium]|nr:hypothetical protein [Anaerolineales bacterium]